MTATNRRAVVALVSVGVAVAVGAVLFTVLVVLPFFDGIRLTPPIAGDTDLTERNLSRDEQMRLLDAHSPVPVPPSASDVRLRYQRFQDWYFEGSFTLPPADFDAYVRGLQPGTAPGVYAGKQIGPHTGSVRVDMATRRVTVLHFST